MAASLEVTLAGRLGRVVRIGLFGLLLELVTGSRAGTRANRTAHDRSGRASHGTADDGATNGTCRPTGTRAGFLVTLGCLPGHRTAGRAEGAANNRADRPTDDPADDGTTHRAGGSADGLAGMLLVVGRRAIGVEVTIEIGPLIVALRVVH